MIRGLAPEAPRPGGGSRAGWAGGGADVRDRRCARRFEPGRAVAARGHGAPATSARPAAGERSARRRGLQAARPAARRRSPNASRAADPAGAEPLRHRGVRRPPVGPPRTRGEVEPCVRADRWAAMSPFAPRQRWAVAGWTPKARATALTERPSSRSRRAGARRSGRAGRGPARGAGRRGSASRARSPSRQAAPPIASRAARSARADASQPVPPFRTSKSITSAIGRRPRRAPARRPDTSEPMARRSRSRGGRRGT